jgi:hypothetical protein
MSEKKPPWRCKCKVCDCQTRLWLADWRCSPCRNGKHEDERQREARAAQGYPA